MNSKGVSEVVGYIFVFGIVLSTLAYAYIHVSNLIKDTSESYRVEGLRESFKRVQNVFFLSAYGGAPVQTLQIELQGGNFYVDDDPAIKVTVTTISEPVINGKVGSIVFKYGDYKVVVENGAVFEDYYGYHRTVVDPRIFIQQVEIEQVSGAKGNVTMAVFYIVNGNLSISGYGPVELIFSSRVRDSYFFDTSGTINITVTSEFSERWWEYFRNRLGIATTPNSPPSPGEPVSVQINFDRAVVTVYEVNVSYRMI